MIGRRGLGNRRITDEQLARLSNLALLGLAALELTRADQYFEMAESYATRSHLNANGDFAKVESNVAHADRCWENAQDIIEELRQRGWPHTDQPTWQRIQEMWKDVAATYEADS